MQSEIPFVKRGMDNLVVDTTAISFVDGHNGSLLYRGIDIESIALHATFEETAYLLIFKQLPTKDQLAKFTWKLRQMTQTIEPVIRIIQEMPQDSAILASLQSAMAALSCFNDLPENQLESMCLRVIAQTPILVAAAYRHCLGMPVLQPRLDLSYAENFLYMICGSLPSKGNARLMEIALLIQMDHGFNSSTFTARAVASTLSDPYSSISAAVGALSGALHGGASEKVTQMLADARQFPTAADFVKDSIAQNKRIMGMGHRVYKVVDPRARIFETELRKLENESDSTTDFYLLHSIAQAAEIQFKDLGRKVFPNVDFWSGTLYAKIGLTPILYPAIFATSRVSGWVAHILELRENNRLYRPKSQYIGLLNQVYVPLAQRQNESIDARGNGT